MSKQYILVALIFCILIAVMTFPLVFKADSYLPGFFSTDESYAVLWGAWFNQYSFTHGLSFNKTDFISYPFGIDFYANTVTGFTWFGINYLLAIFTTPVLTYNIQVILNLFLTCFFTYLLVLYLTKDRLAGIFSGVILGFSPYIMVRSWQHLGETYLWVLPLLLYFLFRLRDKPNFKTGIFFILTLVLSTTINFDTIYYIFLMVMVFLLVNCADIKANFGYIKRIVGLSGIAGLILIPQLLPLIVRIFNRGYSVASAHNIFYRPFEDIFAQSARPLSYFLPAAAHPVFGRFTEQFVGTQLYGSSFTEHTLYLGWVPLMLAFVAFKAWRRPGGKAGSVKDAGNLGDSLLKTGTVKEGSANLYIGYFVFLAVAAWLFSQPPWWEFFGFKIYMPSFFMYKALPMFRAYCRFGIVVMLAVSCLAGFGLTFFLKRYKRRGFATAAAIVLIALVLFEFWNYPPYKVIDVSKVPAVYYWLRQQPGDIVIAEYPLDADTPDEMYKFYQITHQKKMVNATKPGTAANLFARDIVQLSSARTAGVLKWMGVKYVLAHSDGYLNTELTDSKDEFNRIALNPGLKRVKTFFAEDCPQDGIMCVRKTGPIDVYEVIAQPLKPEVKE